MKLTDESGGKSFEPPPAGTHIARCVQVIDVGTQHWDSPMYGPQTKRKLRLTFELPFVTRVFDEDKGEEPMFVSGEFTASLNEKAKLRQMLVGWRGRDFSDDELAGFESRNVLDKAAMIALVHTKKGDRTYANINSISKLPSGEQFKCPPAKNPLIYFSLATDEFSGETFAQLPEWLQKKISESDEYKALEGGGIELDQTQPNDADEGRDVEF